MQQEGTGGAADDCSAKDNSLIGTNTKLETVPLAGTVPPGQTHANGTTRGLNSQAERTGERPGREHSFLTNVTDVREMEHDLLKLLDDFHSGKLQAFGQDCSFEKMDQIREQQETLAKLHFDLDSQQKRRLDKENRKDSDKNMKKLVDKLQNLSISIQTLQREGHHKT